MLFDTTLIILCALPGAGKTTWAKEKVKENHNWVHISSDNIRIEHDYKISNEEVFNIMWERTKESALNCKGIIYDATNIRAKNRVHLIEQYKNFCDIHGLTYTVECALFLQPIDILLERNALRTGRECVPEDVIWRMAKQFQFPMMWEGYHTIGLSDRNEGSFLPMDEIGMMSQDNPHHTMSLGEHLFTAAEKAISADLPKEVCDAVFYHDVGKFYCKEFDENGVAHYYGHENIGAYVLALHFLAHGKLSSDGFYRTVCLVNYHMRPYVWKNSERAQNKDKQNFGALFYYQLLDIHYCDEAAH